MNDPIDIKTKKVFEYGEDFGFIKDHILEVMQKDIVSHMDLWAKFQSQWCNKAYKTFRDYDKYLVLIFLFNKVWQSLHDKFTYQSLDEFYARNEFYIEKINLIEISQALEVPKETIRRKINEFQNENILIRKGKSIIINKKAIDYQKPVDAINTISVFSAKKFRPFEGQEWYGEKLDKEKIEDFFQKYFTICWNRFFKLQIPFLIRWKRIMGDLETWTVWGNIGINSQFNLKRQRQNIDQFLKKEEIDYPNYFNYLVKKTSGSGINASSISDISTIPRATVIRKLNWLTKNGLIQKNKRLEYSLKGKGKIFKKVNQNFLINQNSIAEFLTDILDLIKNSKFKI